MQGNTETAKIFRIIESGNVKKLMKLLKEGILSYDCINEDGDTPFLLVAKLGKFDMVRELWCAGCDLAHGDKDGKIYHDIVNYSSYLQHNYGEAAIRNIQSGKFNSSNSLNVKIARGCWVASEILSSLELDKADQNGNTPLMIAVRYGDLELVTMLISIGCSPTKRNLNGDTPLDVAKNHLKYYARFNKCPDYEKDTIVKLLSDASLFSSPNNEERSYEFAKGIFFGDEKKVHKMLYGGYDIDSENMIGYTPLLMAILSENVAMIKLIMSQQPNVDRNGDTPILFAIKKCDRMVEVLLPYNCNLDLPDPERNTPLLVALRYGNFAVTKKIFCAGGDPFHKNNKGQDALAIAKDLSYISQNASSMDFWNTINECKGNKFMMAILRGNIKEVDKMRRDGYDINAKDESGRTLLLGAIYNKKKYLAQMLVYCSCDVNCVDKNGNTPFIAAMEKRDEKLVIALCESGCNMRVKNKNGIDALTIAQNMGYQQGLMVLARNGINICAPSAV